MNILVLGGGNSPEREVSQRSAAAVQAALVELGHDVSYADPAEGDAAVQVAAREVELVFPILHGVGGEDGSVQRLLDEVGVAYLGSDVAASELCFDKERLKGLLRENDILTPRGEVVDAESFGRSELAKAPFVLKPVADGSSMGMLIARELPYDAARAQELLAKHDEMLLEELIVGVEITVPVLDVTALPVIEIVPPEGGEFDYENKYNGATREICPAEHVSTEVQARAQRLAERIHALARARHLSRTDMIVADDGRVYVLEINTLPGMTAQSLFPQSAAVAGLPWVKLVERFVELTRRG